VSWKRLESASVDPDLAEGLEARVADPLWMLARQWQTGEFKGDDAANPLLMRIEARSVRLSRLVLPGGGRALDLTQVGTPLEPLVEREPIRQGPSGPRVAVDLGRLLVRALQRAGAPAVLLHELRSSHGVELPPDDGLDPTGRRRLELLARTAVHGPRLAAALTHRPTLIDELLVRFDVAEAVRRRVTGVVTVWRRIADELFSEPEGVTTWDPERMEYGFELEAPAPDGGQVRLTTADGYAGGRLDWYAFDRAKPTRAATDEPQADVIVRRAEVLPAPLRFRGMPAARFWEFEEGDVYLGGIEAAPEDLARAAVARYGIVYGDDWFLLPLRIPLGTLTQITQVTVRDDFGRTTAIPAAAVVDGGDDGRAFKFFELSGDHNPASSRAPLLFLPPTVETTDAGRPLEDVRFLRDEMANVAWAIEHRIESAAGRPVDLAARRAPPPPARASHDDAWRLLLSTSVPSNWVPLVPVRVVGGSTSGATDATIMLQRGRMPVVGDPSATRGALGEILVPDRRLLVHEEEIPLAGIRVVRRFQSARDQNGRLHTWVGRRKGPGRGEGSSGLVFDILERTSGDRRATP
jgi:hypothetical protein